MMSTETSVVSRNNKTKQKNAKKTNERNDIRERESCENRMQVADTVRILNVMHQFFSIYSSMVEGDGL